MVKLTKTISRSEIAVIPGLNYILAEKTLGKYDTEVKVLNELPVDLQDLAGKGYR